MTLYNKAKHEVNMLEERPRLFLAADAIVCYFCARIIEQAVLTELKYPLSLNTYEINNWSCDHSPSKEIKKTGNIYPNGRVWCHLDALLTFDTISDARDLTKKRME